MQATDCIHKVRYNHESLIDASFLGSLVELPLRLDIVTASTLVQ